MPQRQSPDPRHGPASGPGREPPSGTPPEIGLGPGDASSHGRRDAHAGELSFKEMCARFEVTPRTLRYYEYIELLSPRREGRTRHYGPRELARMTLILRGRRCGFSLEDIRQWLAMREAAGSEVQMRRFIDLAGAQLEALAERRAQIEDVMGELSHLRDLAARGVQGAAGEAPEKARPRLDLRA